MRLHDRLPRPRGRVRFGYSMGGVLLPATGWHKNLVLYDWATIVGNLLTLGSSAYKIGGMYLEFENVASPGDPVSPPTVTRADGLSYYSGLEGSPDRDYLRVPLLSALLDGDQMTFVAQSQGTEGVNGVAFGAASNSKLFGAALVAMPDEDDPTQDIVFSRFYAEEADQIEKPDSAAQLTATWGLQLS